MNPELDKIPRVKYCRTVTIKLAIGCYNYLIGEGIKKLLRDDKDVDIIGIFTEGLDLREIVKMTPDIVLIDFNIFRELPEDFAIDMKTKILLIGGSVLFPEPYRQVADLIAKGVVGILPPGADISLLKKAIRVVSSGELWLERKTMSNILSHESVLRRKRVDLTDTEKEIVSLICLGYRNKEIAQKLNVSEQTVKSHCNRIFKKVGVTDRLQLAVKLWPLLRR